MKYNTIIFDLDGTLLNTLEDLAYSVNAVMKSEGYPQRTIAEIKAFIGNGVQMLMTRSLPEGTSQNEIMRCLGLFREIYKKNMYTKTKPYEGILEMLDTIKTMGMRTGVVSNKHDEATKVMCKYFFGDNINVAIGDNHVRAKKPAPDNVLAALEELHANKDNSIYVGDSNVDVETAKNAGLVCVGVTWGYRTREILAVLGADYIIDEPCQLIPLIEGFTGS